MAIMAKWHRSFGFMVLLLLNRPGFADSTTFYQVLQQALTSNPQIAQFRHRVTSSEADLDEAEWRHYPSLSSSWQQTDEGDTISSVVVSQPVWSGGRITSYVDSAKARLEISEAQADETVRSVLTEVSSIYFELIKMQALHDVAVENESQYKRLYDIISRRSESEVSPEIDKTLSSSRLEIASIEKLQLEREIQSLYERFAEVTGRDYRAYDFISPSLPLSETMLDLLASGYEASPTRKKLAWQLELASSEIKEKKAERYPEVNVNYQKNFGDFSSSQRSDELTLSLTYETGQGLSKNAAIEADVYRRDSVLEEIKAYRKEYDRVMRDKWFAIENFKRLLPSQQKASDGADAVIESYMRQFQVGKKSWLDVLNAQRERNQSLGNYIRTKMDLQRLKADLMLYTGVIAVSRNETLSWPKE